MRLRILLLAFFFCAFFVAGGLYIAHTTSKHTAQLDRLIHLHRVGLLREQLLDRVKTVQLNVKAKHTRFFAGADATISSVLAMDAALEGCFECHRGPTESSLLVELRERAREYETSISRMITIRANSRRLAREEDAAYALGAGLIERIDEMISTTRASLEQRTRSVIREIARSKRMLYLLLAVGPLMSLILATILVKSLAEPISLLLQGTRRLRAGDLEHRVTGLRHEFRELGASFNEMAQSLKDQMQKMQRAEQMAVCGEVAAGLAHEIKNPLAGINISLQVLGEDLDLSPEDQELFTRAKDEIGRIDTLVKHLLEFARPQEPEFQPANVNDILEKAIAFQVNGDRAGRSAGSANRVSIQSEYDAALPEIVADPKQLLQVFLNLILNGIEAMPNGGTLSVKTRSSHDGNVYVDVCDEGEGVSPEVAEKIFEPFFTKKVKGTGLGLAISRTLIEQHGGEITVSSQATKGACFTVRLPSSELGKEA